MNYQPSPKAKFPCNQFSNLRTAVGPSVRVTTLESTRQIPFAYHIHIGTRLSMICISSVINGKTFYGSSYRQCFQIYTALAIPTASVAQRAQWESDAPKISGLYRQQNRPKPGKNFSMIHLDYSIECLQIQISLCLLTSVSHDMPLSHRPHNPFCLNYLPDQKLTNPASVAPLQNQHLACVFQEEMRHVFREMRGGCDCQYSS